MTAASSSSGADGPKPGQFTAMISSTALDLPEHRAAVKEACLAAGVFPIGMEHLPARDASGITVSLEMVDKADIYLGIYAWRYGWVPDGKDISITEMEFDRAAERKAAVKLREILIFTAHKDHPCTVEAVEADKDAQKKLAAFKTKASTGRVRKEFSSAEELRRIVSDALHEFIIRQQAAHSTTPASAPASTFIPNNLPSLQPFFGREDELRKIADALDPESRGWGALIDGSGGMGKTSLAVRAAYDCPPADFERIVFVSAKQQEQDDLRLRPLGDFALGSWLEMLNGIAGELKLEDVLKAPKNERARRLSIALKDRRILLVLDNLETLTPAEQDQLFTFLEYLPGGCKALLTSREFAGNKLLAMKLHELDLPTALKLLAKVALHSPGFAKSTEAERTQLHHDTNGNPLLLRWVAGQVGIGDCTSVADALGRLRSCPPGNAPLSFIFDSILAQLSDGELQILATLTHPAQPIPVEAIAEISAVPLEHTRTALKSLTNRPLVVPGQNEQAYALVPLVADFLRKKKPEVVAETGDRLEQRAYALIMENGGEKHDRFQVLDAAWPAVAPAIPRFLAGPNDRLQTVCHALSRFLKFTGRWDEWLSLNQQAESKAIATGDIRSAAARAHDMGWVHYLRQEADAVLRCAETELKHRDSAEAGARERASAIRLRGLGHRLKKDYPAAIADYDIALGLYGKSPPENEDDAIVLNYRGEAERLSGNLEAAERDYRRSLDVATAALFSEGIACFTGDLAALALDRGDWPGAETLAREALPLSENVGREELIASDCRCLAIALVRQSKAAEALPYALRSVAIYTKLGSPELAGARDTLAECEAALAKTGE